MSTGLREVRCSGFLKFYFGKTGISLQTQDKINIKGKPGKVK